MLVGCCCLQALFLDTFPSTFLCLLYADAYRVQPEALAQFSIYTAVKVSSGLGRVLPPLGLLAAALCHPALLLFQIYDVDVERPGSPYSFFFSPLATHRRLPNQGSNLHPCSGSSLNPWAALEPAPLTSDVLASYSSE